MLDHLQRIALVKIARTAIEYGVTGQKADIAPPADKLLSRPMGAFVTIHKQRELRGCIGMIEPNLPLWQSVQQMAAAAATEDFRFMPLRPADLSDVRIEISVLSSLVKVKDLERIQTGLHGLVAEQGGRRGLLLPQVAREWGWNREDFLSYTCEKAGLQPLAWTQGADIYSFTAEVFGEEEDDPLQLYIHLPHEEAVGLLRQHLATKNLIKHCLAAEAVLGEIARTFNEDEPNWRLCGLVHDIDYDLTVSDMSRHTLVAEEILLGQGFNRILIDAVKAHNNFAPREHLLAKTLWSVDPLTGFLVAAALITTEKKLSFIDVSFVMNRMKEKSFARAVSREQIASCEEWGMTLESFIAAGLEAMQKIAPQLGL